MQCFLSVSFNSVIPRAQSFFVTSASNSPVCTIKCCSVVFGVTLRLLVIHFVVVSAINKLRRLPATSVINSSRSIMAECIALGVHSTRWSQILAENRNFCLLHLHSTPPLAGSPSEYCHDVCYGKTRVVWLPDGEKK